MSFQLKWQKLRVHAEIRQAFDQAVGEFNQSFGGNFRVITHPFGKVIACPAADLWFFHVGNGGRPAQIWTLVLVTGLKPKPLFPSQKEWDFDECCHHLGYQTEADRHQFRQFLSPYPSRISASTTQGQGAV